jgi:hypothetical protein
MSTLARTDAHLGFHVTVTAKTPFRCLSIMSGGDVIGMTIHSLHLLPAQSDVQVEPPQEAAVLYAIFLVNLYRFIT